VVCRRQLVNGADPVGENRNDEKPSENRRFFVTPTDKYDFSTFRTRIMASTDGGAFT
jgi:hypothetical protein